MSILIKIGIIGINEGNGHPYSFSAIINGFNEEEFKKSNWLNIYNYLKERDKSDFGICNAKVTHIWTQDRKESEKIAKATFIENVVDNFEDMRDEVDAVMILRDDYETHLKFAKPFLEAGKFVFIDKPLSLDISELKYFKPFLQSNKLMSCSGIRYAIELDKIKNKKEDFKFIRATCIKDWDKYAIHMLDGVFSIVDWKVKNVLHYRNLYILECENDKIIEICMLGNYHYPILKFEFFGDDYYQIEIKDYFIAFKRLLSHFLDIIKNKRRDCAKSIELMNILIKGLNAKL
jgi:hypothetical protein